jgi:hypothetical protein
MLENYILMILGSQICNKKQAIMKIIMVGLVGAEVKTKERRIKETIVF